MAVSGRMRKTLGGVILAGIAAAVAIPLMVQRSPQIDLLLLITVDTLRADHLGAYGNTDGLTPTLDALAAESLVFQRAYTVAPFTLPSITAIQTGRYPRELGIVNNRLLLPEETRTLAQHLRSLGWRTGAVVSNYVLRRSSGLARGFDHYDDRYPQLEAHRPDPERIGVDTTDAALALLDGLLESREQPIFLWVHYQDPHGPYRPPGNRRERHIESERAKPDGRQTLELSGNQDPQGRIPRYQFEAGHNEVAYYRAGYKGEVEYVDQEIGRFLAGVRGRVPRQRTAIVFTADHGEGLGEDDYWFGHGMYLSDAQMRIPMLIQVPGQTAGTRSDAASVVDVFATLLGLAGESPPDSRSRNLVQFGAARRDARLFVANFNSRLPRMGIVTRDFKYIVTADGSAAGLKEELFRPLGEAHELSEELPEVVERMRRVFAEVQQEIPNGNAARAQYLSEIEQARLRALGYAE